MKKVLLFSAAFLVFFLCIGQSVMTFQPSGGLNDGTDSGTLTTGKDTWVNRFAPDINNGDGATVLSSPRSNCNPSDYKSYFQFDVTALPDDVDSVFFGVTHIEHTSSCLSNCDADFYFYYTTSPWNEMTLILSNEPSENPTAFYGPINITFPNNLGTREYDITNAYNNWKTNGAGNFGFTTYSPTLGCNNISAGFYVFSSDDTLETRRPYLKIYYTAPTGVNEGVLHAKTDKYHQLRRLKESSINAYPNPFNDYLKFESFDFDQSFDQCYLVDVTGQKFNLGYDFALGGFNASWLNPGMYILHVIKGNEHFFTKVFKPYR